jgi:hypothetical protein
MNEIKQYKRDMFD